MRMKIFLRLHCLNWSDLTTLINLFASLLLCNNIEMFDQLDLHQRSMENCQNLSACSAGYGWSQKKKRFEFLTMLHECVESGFLLMKKCWRYCQENRSASKRHEGGRRSGLRCFLICRNKHIQSSTPYLINRNRDFF